MCKGNELLLIHCKASKCSPRYILYFMQICTFLSIWVYRLNTVIKTKWKSSDSEKMSCTITMIVQINSAVACGYQSLQFVLVFYVNLLNFLERSLFSCVCLKRRWCPCVCLKCATKWGGGGGGRRMDTFGFPFLAQLISCAITNYYLRRDCRCRWHQCRHRRHWDCRQKLTSRSVPI